MSNTGNDNAMHSGHRPTHRVRWGVAGTIGLVGALGVSAFMVLPSVSASPSDKVTICHATSSTSNPYTVNTISTSSVDEKNNKYLNGHGGHTGPVYTPDGGAGWGDIIPPFTDAQSGVSFPGLNWGPSGQAIFNADCNYASPSPTATPTETSASPTPTSGSPSPTPTSIKVTLCHRTGATSNPYSTITVDTSSVDSEANEYLNGHGDHTGPVFAPGITSDWGDIIPPFEGFPGYNWTSAGQAIWGNDCNYTTPSPTPTPTETTSSPTPTPTETTSSPTPTPTETTVSPTPTPITTSPAPITTSPTPTFSPEPTPTPTPTETSVSPTPTPITTSPAPITTSPAPTSSPSPTPITTPSVDGTPTPPAPVTTDNPNPSGGLPTSVPAGGGPGELPGKPTWLWLIAAAFLALLIASMRQLLPGRERS